MKIIEIQCTFPDFGAAREISNLLVREKFIACANILATQSLYIWDEKYHQDSECIVFMKTSIEKHTDAVKEIRRLHSYSMPAIIYWEVHTSEDYGIWVMKMTSNELAI